jgi:large subunit ribosomal protein L24
MLQRIRKNDNVVVIAGKHKGTRGRVLKVLAETDRVLVEGVGRVKRHQKPTQKMPQGGIVEKDSPIHLSKVALWDAKSDKPSRVRIGKDKDGNKVRTSVRTGESLES